ncbi:MAG TPA: ABC transporter ATP-binding protein [Acidisarcina sp.]|nr:ABC transporter ATP-binding protein [Acidisarcina sp.]
MTAALEFVEISKHYGKLIALDRLSLSVNPGEILGFVGPNGAGKTTAIYLALGFLRATSGKGRMLGHEFGSTASRLRLGFLPDAPTAFAGSAQDAALLAGRLNGVADTNLRVRARELLLSLDLPPTGRDARQFSRGMQQRLGLVEALVNNPDLLILDEPTSALDPPGVLQVREILRGARYAGKSVFFSSHQLSEVEQLCDRVAFLHEGRLLRCGNLDELMTDSSRTEVVVRGANSSGEGLAPFAKFRVAAPQKDGETKWVLPAEMARQVIEAAWTAGGELLLATPMRRTLEDLFVEWNADGSMRPQP